MVCLDAQPWKKPEAQPWKNPEAEAWKNPEAEAWKNNERKRRGWDIHIWPRFQEGFSLCSRVLCF
jgi:hypothetical protein